MSYLVLARKWRPQRFDEVIGQRHVSLTLANALKTDRLSHAHLFAGPRGVGKTSVARILAKALNCEAGPSEEPCNQCDACRSITAGHCLDVLEIDGASNRGIDDVRQLRESVKYASSSVRTKVYIIDEVHMLTTDAFNALLKTLEEPPKHVCFVLATTEPLKVPPTILSRCQRFDFGRISAHELQGHLRRIADAEGVDIEEEALLLLARKAEGSVRDGLTLLDQVTATGDGPFSTVRVQEILGLSGNALYFEISAAVISGDAARALILLQEAHRGGVNLQEVAGELVHHFRNILLLSLGKGLEEIIEVTADESSQFARQVRDVRPADALRWLRILLDVCARMRRSAHGRVHLEVALAEMACLPRAVDLGRVLARLRETATPGKPSGPNSAGAGSAGSLPPGHARGAGRVREEAALVDELKAPVRPRERRVPEAGGGRGAPGDPGHAAGDLAHAWAQIVNRVRGEKAFLGSCLHESRLMGLKDGRLIIALDDANGFKCDQVEKPANRRFILRVVEEVLGCPMGIRTLSGSEAAALPEQQAAGGPEKGAGAASHRLQNGAQRIARLMDGDIVGPAL